MTSKLAKLEEKRIALRTERDFKLARKYDDFSDEVRWVRAHYKRKLDPINKEIKRIKRDEWNAYYREKARNDNRANGRNPDG